MRTIIYLSLSLLVALSGCSDRQDSSSSRNEPIVTVGGHTLTQEMLKRRVGMMDALNRHKRPKIPPKQAGQYCARLAKSYPKVFVEAELVAELARREKVELTGEQLAKYETNAFFRLRVKGDKTYGDLKRSIGEFGDELDAQVRGEALRGALIESLLKKNPKKIPETYVDDTIKSINDYNARMTLTNALIYAHATNVWQQLKNGADFAETAATYSTIPDEQESKGEWGMVDERQLQDDPAILEWGRKLKIGEFSPPIEGDNGLMIMRLDTRDEKMTEFGISRIFFQLPEFYVAASREEIVKEAERKHARSVFAQKISELEKELKPVYHMKTKKGTSK